MYPQEFTNDMAFILRKDIEGGYYDGHLPSDPNPTKWGMTQKSYHRWYSGDVRDMTLGQCYEIYYKAYWLASRCNYLPLPIRLIQFDTAVNCGDGNANKFYDRTQNPLDYIAIRLEYYKKIIAHNKKLAPNWNNWQSRLIKLRQACGL